MSKMSSFIKGNYFDRLQFLAIGIILLLISVVFIAEGMLNSPKNFLLIAQGGLSFALLVLVVVIYLIYYKHSIIEKIKSKILLGMSLSLFLGMLWLIFYPEIIGMENEVYEYILATLFFLILSLMILQLYKICD